LIVLIARKMIDTTTLQLPNTRHLLGKRSTGLALAVFAAAVLLLVALALVFSTRVVAPLWAPSITPAAQDDLLARLHTPRDWPLPPPFHAVNTSVADSVLGELLTANERLLSDRECIFPAAYTVLTLRSPPLSLVNARLVPRPYETLNPQERRVLRIHALAGGETRITTVVDEAWVAFDVAYVPEESTPEIGSHAFVRADVSSPLSLVGAPAYCLQAYLGTAA